MRAAVLGNGTVGGGAAELLRSAPGLELAWVLVRPGKEREPFHTAELDTILSDPTVDAVAEAMGGVETAYAYARRVLESGKHFVTANKALCAARGLELAALARQKGVGFLFSAACGGGVPFLHNLSLAARSDRIESVAGILNGTTNYMLDAMQSRGLSYAEALAEAQALGYAEADPTADVSGLDALRKLILACAVAFARLPEAGMLCEGIESFTTGDVADLQSRGLTCRLMARGCPAGNTVSACVEPVLFSPGAPECSVKTNYNLARYQGAACGPMVFIGQGAGRYPTASAILRDLVSLAEGQRAMFPADCTAAEADNSRELRSYYIRTDGADGLPPIRKLLTNGPELRAVTEAISPERMHTLAARLRREGHPIFFAAVEEDAIC